jgi:hypothetical protein
MGALTGFVLRHKRLVVGLWLVIWAAAVVALGPAGNALPSPLHGEAAPESAPQTV